MGSSESSVHCLNQDDVVKVLLVVILVLTPVNGGNLEDAVTVGVDASSGGASGQHHRGFRTLGDAARTFMSALNRLSWVRSRCGRSQGEEGHGGHTRLSRQGKEVLGLLGINGRRRHCEGCEVLVVVLVVGKVVAKEEEESKFVSIIDTTTTRVYE